MSKESILQRLNGMTDIVNEHKAKFDLWMEYDNVLRNKEYILEDGLRKAEHEKNIMPTIMQSLISRRRSILFLVDALAVIMAIIITNALLPDNFGIITFTIAPFVIGMLFQLAKLSNSDSPISGGAIVCYIPILLVAIIGITYSTWQAIIPALILIISGIIAPIIITNAVNFNKDELTHLENARQTDAAIKAENKKHITDTELLIKTAEQRHAPLQAELKGLREKMKQMLPEHTDMVWTSPESLCRMILAIESGRADTLEEAIEYSSHIDNMRFQQRMAESRLSFDHLMASLKMQDIEAQKKRELDRARSKENKSKSALDETVRTINDMRKKYEIDE